MSERATDLRPPNQRRAAMARRRGGRERVASLFPEDVERVAAAGRWYGWPAALVLGALVSLGRISRGPGVLNTVWAEDGSDFLSDAYNRTLFATVGRPLNGYFVVVPRLLAEPASLVPVAWGPAVLTIEAALVTSLMALGVYVASRTYLVTRLARLVAAVPVLAVPVGANMAAEASNNVATLQFAGVYCALWMVLWVPRGRLSRVAAVSAVLAVAASTFLAVVLLPLAVVRCYARRDPVSAIMAGGLTAGLAANVTALAVHLTARPVMLPSRYDPVWALSTMADWALPHALLGYGLTGNGGQAVDPQWWVYVAWPVVPLVLAIGLAGLTRPQWRLAAVMLSTAVALTAGTIMQYGGAELRYVIAPELMLFAALAAILLPRPDRRRPDRLRPEGWRPDLLRPGRTALLGLALAVAVVLGFSYRTVGPRSGLSAWTGSVARARDTCANPAYRAVYVFPADGRVSGVPRGTRLREHPPPGFAVLVPCARLR